MAEIRFHSQYTDAAGNKHAQFVFSGEKEIRGEIWLDARRGITALENVSGKLTRDSEVAIKKAWRAA